MATALPEGAYESAMRQYLDLQRWRVEAMYNRHRAVFAEALIAELLGAEVALDPTNAWDLLWERHRGADLRIQVKCSGGYLPRFADRATEAPMKWDVTAPTSGWQEHVDLEQQRLGAGHHCDVFVLARHSGRNIQHGWSFAAVPTALIEASTTRAGSPRRTVTSRELQSWSIELVDPHVLTSAVALAADEQIARRMDRLM